jgi:hypothetical protein
MPAAASEREDQTDPHRTVHAPIRHKDAAMLTRRSIGRGALFLFIVGSVRAQQQFAFPFVDEAERHPGFAAFRERLRSIVGRQDSAALLRQVSSDVRVSHGNEEQGLAAFEQFWWPEEQDCKIWSVLGRLLRLGGVFEADGLVFQAPYVRTLWPNDLDPYVNVAITERAVAVRTQPNVAAPVLGTLSFVIVATPYDFADTQAKWFRDWIRVRATSDLQGFVLRSSARAPLDYQATFAQRGGRWQLISLVAGD